MKKIIAVALFLLSAPAMAQMTCPPQSTVPKDAALLCWTNATSDVNGNPIPAPPADGSLKTTRIQHIYMNPVTLPCDFAAPAEPIQTINVTPDVGSYYFPAGLKVGRHCFRIRHINTKDVMSDWSAIVEKQVAPVLIGKPRPPTVTVDAADYPDEG